MELDLGVGCSCSTVHVYVWGVFDRLVFNVILESFGALVSKCHATQKCMAGCRGKQSEIWDLRRSL